MSSPISLQQLHSADGLAALGAAMVQVAEDSLFAYAEPCDPERFAAMLAERDAVEPWLSASVAFKGPFEGTASVSLPRALAADLCGSFCGVSTDELSEPQVVDFAGELTNMACGLWLTHTHRTERFDLTAPHVSAITGAALAGGAAAGACASGIALNDVPIQIALHPSASEGGG